MDANNTRTMSPSTVDEQCFPFNFKWTVKHFLELPCKVGDLVESKNFGEITKYLGVEWKMHALTYPKGFDADGYRDHLGVYLKIRVEPANACFAVSGNFVISLLGFKEKKLIGFSELGDKTFDAMENKTYDFSKIREKLNSYHNGRGTSKFIKFSDLRNRRGLYLPNGDLNLHFEGKVYIAFDSSLPIRSNLEAPRPKPKVARRHIRQNDSEEEFFQQENFELFDLPKGNLSFRFEGQASNQFNPFETEIRKPDTMKTLFQEGICYDIVLKSGSYEFKGHKCVLSATSDYFRSKFDNGMTENIIDFSDQMNEEELKDLLEFLYLGVVSNLSNTCHTILKVADMFGLRELKHLSEQELLLKLNLDNAWEMVQLARQHGAEKLQKEAHLVLARSLD